MNEKTFSKFNGYVVKDAEARNDIKTINNEIATINNNIGTTNKNVETNKSNIEANAKAITTLNNNIGVINSTIDTIDSSVRSITSDNEALNNRMDDINTAFEGMGDIANNTVEINEKIDNNTEKINVNTGKISTLENKINNIQYEDSLTSTDTTKGLSANQGKVLDEKISAAKEELKVYHKSIISVGLETLQRSVLTSWEYQEINLDQIKAQVGNKLSLANHKVVIGAGVNFIKVSASVEITAETSMSDSFIQVHLLKNEEKIISGRESSLNVNECEYVTLSSILVPVKEGDTISLQMSPSSSDTVEVTNGFYTWVTVEEV